MPTYVYKCDSCGAQFEKLQSFKDEPLQTCPSCAGAVRRVFQPVGIVFKGSGWYVTDSRKSTSATTNGDEAKTETKTETTETKTEAPSTGDTTAAKDTASKPEPASTSTATTSATSATA